jgi:hypothetical protein
MYIVILYNDIVRSGPHNSLPIGTLDQARPRGGRGAGGAAAPGPEISGAPAGMSVAHIYVRLKEKLDT